MLEHITPKFESGLLLSFFVVGDYYVAYIERVYGDDCVGFVFVRQKQGRAAASASGCRIKHKVGIGDG